MANRKKQIDSAKVEPARCSLSTPVGCLELTAVDDAVVAVRFIREGGAACAEKPKHGGALQQAYEELQEYLNGERREFSVALCLPTTATPFQQRVWDAMLRIPYGETRTYGELARELGTGPRAVGGACARNPLPILVPCHRVVGKNGLGGYSGDWETGRAVQVKDWLLQHEAKQTGADAP